MYKDKVKIAIGLVIFGLVAIMPIWYNIASGKAADKLEVQAVQGEKTCVEATAFMKANHMKLLNQWRNSGVRDNVRTYRSNLNGKSYEISLVYTCMSCHTNKEQFCDKCHNYADVTNDCWNCHVDPAKGAK
jgi:hypothetical protein